MLKTVIFDFDGTIMNTFGPGLKIAEELARRDGLEVADKLANTDIETIRGMGKKEVLKSLDISKTKLLFYFMEIRKKLLERVEDLEVFENMPGVLKELAEDYQLGLLTTNNKDLTTMALEANGLYEFFDEIVTGIPLMGKAGRLRKLMKKMDVEEAVYVGDEEADVEACNKDEVPIISVTWGFSKRSLLEEAAPDYIADSPEEIVKIVRAIS